MRWEAMAGDWQRASGSLRLRWDLLTDDDFEKIAGSRERLLDKLQSTYALSAERAEADLRDWERHQAPIAPAGAARPL